MSFRITLAINYIIRLWLKQVIIYYVLVKSLKKSPHCLSSRTLIVTALSAMHRSIVVALHLELVTSLYGWIVFKFCVENNIQINLHMFFKYIRQDIITWSFWYTIAFISTTEQFSRLRLLNRYSVHPYTWMTTSQLFFIFSTRLITL